MNFDAVDFIANPDQQADVHTCVEAKDNKVCTSSELTPSIRKLYQSKLVPILKDVYPNEEIFIDSQLESIAKKLDAAVFNFCKQCYENEISIMYSKFMYEILWIIVWFYPVSDSDKAITIDQCVQGILKFCINFPI